jgi:PII-like signaling protein
MKVSCCATGCWNRRRNWAFRAIAGYGRHGHMHEQTFFELAGELPVQVEFVLGAEKADALLDAVRIHRLNLFYVRYSVESGTV